MTALIKDDDLVHQDTVLAALVVKTRDGQTKCDWDRLARRTHVLAELPAPDSVFLTTVLAIAQRAPILVGRLYVLSDQRLALILRALAALAESTTVTVTAQKVLGN
ncbi:hypothetical protein [Streptomyces sp. NPDC049906]|uniref:hypothetical protein n=1 Tax=Streptomyces sp. NPDC049906 TaxID=3155656 RepID=UPI0034409C87